MSQNPSRTSRWHAHNTRLGQYLGKPEEDGWRRQWYVIIFEAETRAGRQFDVTLLIVILASVLVVMLDSLPSMHDRAGTLFAVIEWLATLLFTAEYVMRILVVRKPWRYVLSFYGVIDFVSILPTWLAVFAPEMAYLIDVRLLRLLRVFRVLKLTIYFEEAQVLLRALVNARRKIFVFLGTVFIITIILGTVMYVVEGPAHGFTSIPVSMYWAVVTLTTTGFGDLVPKTPLGQFITSLTILLGYSIIAFPTGIIGAELVSSMRQAAPASAQPLPTRACTHCTTDGHDTDAAFCKRCGTKLPPHPPETANSQ
ncbi:ion transporter [Ralstonia sp. SET104]|uniref:ion transporter n=1 Tax=Ralstonia sp. SET104 TaxID=2448774 RepID=UPI000F577F8A|nr:ion transporter [Ralstonia sp. SET104]GCB05635.1 ion transporter [Ralstonia sp. SET104]